MRNLVKEFCASSCSTALEMEERRRCTTVRQLEVMLEFLEGHRDLALGRVRSKEARAVAQRLWQECAELLNGLGPARTAKEWSKVWNDQKTKVRAKLLKINASQRATGGGPSNAPTLTPLEDKVANIIGRDVGPLPNIAQDHFAVNEGDTLNESEHIIAQEITVDSDNIEEMLVEGGNISPLVLNMEAAEHEDEVEVPLHQPVLQEQIEPLQSQLEPLATPTAARARRTREHRRSVHASRAPTAQLSVLHQTTPAPQVQSARSALEESRKMIIKIEELKAQTALENAQAANKNAQAAHETAVAINTLSQSFKLIAESIDRMSRQYCASQQIHQQPE